MSWFEAGYEHKPKQRQNIKTNFDEQVEQEPPILEYEARNAIKSDKAPGIHVISAEI